MSSSSSSLSSTGGLRMIEFFSGIGGMRCSVERALKDKHTTISTSLQSCVAYEISLQANETYEYNFCDLNGNSDDFQVKTKLVEQLKVSELDGKADLWTMSPPCQPFTTTRNSKQCDMDDKRTLGFRSIMKLLTSLHEKPKWILLENVKGFVGSQALKLWYQCLSTCGYTWREYVLNPISTVQIPNNRTRYYMICELSNRWQTSTLKTMSENKSQIYTSLESDSESIFFEKQQNNNQTKITKEIQPLSNFLSTTDEEINHLSNYIIPDDILRKPWASQLPIVTRNDRITYCFTAAYGRIYHKATGSFLLMYPTDRPACADLPIERCTDMSTLYSNKLRRFTPKELLGLFGFPSSFAFPDSISLEKQYKLIGNSINVFVVTKIVIELLKDNKDNTHL